MAETDHMNELQEMKELSIIRIASCAKRRSCVRTSPSLAFGLLRMRVGC